jgi:low temperature requirement protein LtrA
MGVQVGEQPKPSGVESSRWVRPPRLRTLEREPGERRATWLELFFDLVFVVAIAQLSHELAVDHSTGGFLRFAALFVPVFVAWQGFSFYADRFDTDDLVLRLAFFAGMLAIAAMSVLVPDVWHGARSTGFALAYISLRALIVALYGRAWRAVPEARPLIRLYGGGYAVAVAIWAVSLALDTPYRYVLWGIALALDLSLPPLSTRLHRRVPTSSAHVPERWALFTMIVLGESVVVVALGAAGSEWDVASAGAAVMGFACVASVWWLYFDRQEGVVLQGGTPSVVVYSYAHLPLLMALASLSAGVALLIERAGEDELGLGAATALMGGAMLFLLSLIATRVVTVHAAHRLGVSMKLAAVALMAALLAAQSALRPVALGGCLLAVLVALVYLEHALLARRAEL